MQPGKSVRIVIIIALSWLLGLFSAYAEQVRIASASNFTAPMRELSAQFEAQTGHTAKLSFASSGKLYAQIAHGAPYDLFFSADQDKPQRLISKGMAQPDSQFTYAVGVLALWSNHANNQSVRANLIESRFARIALANPKLAPFGAAAQQVLAALDTNNTQGYQLVKGDNVAQAYQFVHSGNADAGFVALSQIRAKPGVKGTIWIVPAQLHSPIYQDAVVLKRGVNNPAAYQFIRFIQSDQARRVIASFGYAFDEVDAPQLASTGG